MNIFITRERLAVLCAIALVSSALFAISIPSSRAQEASATTAEVGSLTDGDGADASAIVVTDPVVSTTEPAASPITTESETSTTEDAIVAAPEVTQTTAVVEALPVVSAVEPTLSTDKADYAPGETVSIFGKFFSSLQDIVVRIFGNSEAGNHYSDVSIPVTTDSSGSFSLSHLLDNFYRPIYNVIATALDGTQLATMSFTDAAGAGVDVFSQCANNLGVGPTCSWTNGALNSSNSTYTEEDSTVQRLVISGLSNGAHTVVIEYQTTKGGKHAYDFLTNDTASETWVTDADLCSGPVTTAMPSCTSLPENISPAIPQDPLNTLGTTATNQHFKIRNGTITSFGTPTVVSGSYPADSLTDIAVNFTVNTATCADASGGKCPVFMTWGAHVSSQADWGAGSSVVNISGSPYHVKVVELDGASTGNRDNQMAASAIIIPNTVTVHKVTSDGSATSFAFTTTGTGYAGFSLSNGQQNQQSVTPGSYSVTETSPLPAYANTALTCTASGTGSSATPTLGTRSVAITIGSAGGAVIDCIYTNTLQQAHLTLVKTVTNDNGGTAVPTAWTLAAAGPTPLSGVTATTAVTNAAVNAGAYTLSENSGPANYTAGTYSCVKNGGGAVVSDSITLAAGDNAICTINNNDNAPALHLRKVVVNNNGGSATVANFTLTANGTGTNDLSGTSPVDSGAGLLADTWALSESAVAGYSASSWVCVGGTPNGANITVGIGQSATCTITNDDIAPTLTLVKYVINDNGGSAVTTDFQGKVDGNNVAWSVATPLSAGAHTASETTLSGYTASSWGGDCAANGTITLALGENKTCSITNDDQQAYIVLNKTVINDNGGTAQPNDFLLKVDGGAALDEVSLPVNPGAHVASETLLSGYTAGSWGGDCDAQGNVSVALGQVKTCTITNNDIAPKLHLRKVVTNDNGGNATVANFTLTANGTDSNDLSGTSPVDSGAGLKADTWALSETSPAGYSASAWSCVGGTQDGSNITVGINEEATCTITNNDVAPKLHLRKVVTNDNGGTATVADFTLTANGTDSNDLSGTSPVDSGATLLADTWVLSETPLAGYTASAWSCVGGTQNGSSITVGIGGEATCTITNDDQQAYIIVDKTVVNDNGGNAVPDQFILTVDANPVLDGIAVPVNPGIHTAGETLSYGYTAGTWGGDCNSNASVTVALGETKTCTITNNDIAPKLHLRKVIVNDNGGTATVADFPLSADGTGSNDVSGTSPVDSGAGLLADTFTLSETPLAGYSASTWACVGGKLTGSEIKLVAGDEATCTITNDDIAPSLTLVKVVDNDNGGTATEANFTLTATGPTGFSGAGPSVSNGASFDAGAYALTESALAGYTAGDWGCVGGTQNGASVTLGLGESATCTIHNADNAPHLHLNKVVVNDNGGTALESAWDLTATGPTSITGPGAAGSPDVSSGAFFDAGEYVLSESAGPAGYTASGWTCTNGDNDGTISIGLGETVTCTITNNDIAPKLHLRKIVTNDNGGTALDTAWTLTANGAGTNDLSGSTPVDSDGTLVADTWTLSESGPAGYTASAWVCVGGTQNGSNITVGINGEATCTITNDDNAPALHLRKVVVTDNGGTATVADFTLTADGATTNDLSGTSPVDSGATLKADTWTLSETAVTGYTASAWVCVGGIQGDATHITLGLGQEATCTITNNDISPILTIVKNATPNDLQDFAFSGTGIIGAFQLDDDDGVSGEDATFSNSKTFNNLKAGLGYTVTETLPNPFWTFEGATCVVTESVTPYPFTPTTNGVTINLGLADNVTCTITNHKESPTRTQGFWQTHTNYTNGIFASKFAGDGMLIGTGASGHKGYIKNITTPSGLSQLYGAYWSNIAKKTVGGNRTAIEKARMQLLQQLVTAKLNCAAFTCSGTIAGQIAAADAAYAGASVSAILASAGLLDLYNNSGDTLTIDSAGSATPSLSKSLANLAFWNLP